MDDRRVTQLIEQQLPDIGPSHRLLILAAINSILWAEETEQFAVEKLQEIEQFYNSNIPDYREG